MMKFRLPAAATSFTKASNNADSSATTATATTAAPTSTFAMQVLMEECATLKKRVKELEDSNDGTDGSGKTVDLETDAEMASLRKELTKVENEKATMELDFMNQLSQIARDGAEQVDAVKEKLVLVEKELAEKGNVSSSSSDSENPELDQLKADLASADQELKVNRRDVEDLHKKVTKLEGQKTALIDEVTSVRMEVDNESKTILSLNAVMAENEKHFASRIEKLEQELMQRNTVINKHADELKAVNDTAARFEGQKSMLLEEITDLRMQLDRNDDAKKALKKKVTELEQASSGEEESTRMGTLKQAASEAEEKAEEWQEKVTTLEAEVCTITKTHKADVVRLEETISAKDAELEEVRQEMEKTEAQVEKLNDEKAALVEEARELNFQTEEAKRATTKAEQEVESLNNQRISYEKRSTQCIMDHLADADDANDKVSSLEIQVKTLEVAVSQEKTKNMKLKSELDAAAKQRPPLPAAAAAKKIPPVVCPPSPSRPPRAESPSWSSSRPASPSWTTRTLRPVPSSPSRGGGGSVRALAAGFETRKAEPDAALSPVNSAATTVVATFMGPDVESLQNQVAHLENELETAQSLNDLLHQKLEKQSEQVGELQAEVATMTATRSAIETLSRKDFDEESQQYKSTIEKLEFELAAARKQLEEKTNAMKALKDEIRGMTSERLAYEECTMEAYEKRAVTSQKTYQGELNSLKVELTHAQMKIADFEKEHKTQVKDFEQTIEELNAECDKELEEKQGELDMIKYKLDEQKDMVEKLQKEREQLCTQMNNMSNTRRDDLEEIQADLMERTTENTSLQRALQSLQMQVEHQVDNTRELEGLRTEVRKLEARVGPTGTALHKQQFEVERITAENKKLREQIRQFATERRGLQERLNTVMTDQSVNRSVNVMRDRNEKLKREVERLTKKLAKIEGSVSRIAI